MKHYPKLVEVVVVLLVVVFFTNGCMMTRELWTERYYHPHAKPELRLAASPERPLMLVAYREQFEKSKHIRWRAFWVDLEDRYEPYVKPNFVDPADYAGLIPIPVLTVTQGTNSLPRSGYGALTIPNKPGFELWHDGNFVGRYHLPSYEGDAPVTTETVAKTPLTLLADGVVITVVVLVVAAIIVGYGMAEGDY